MKLLLVILEGQLYLAGVLAVFVAELTLLAWGLWSRRPVIGLIAVFAAVPLLRSTISAIRACFIRIPPPEGLALGRDEGGALYGLVDDVRRIVGGPPIDGIVISSDFAASAVPYTAPWRWRQQRFLALGLPVLTTLSTEELRSVIGHELAHFSGAHDAFGAWVYRTRRSWVALRAALDQRGATPIYVYWLLWWYVPRLNAASAEIARRHELAADRVAATVAGSRATADALVVFESGARFADDTHWPAIEASSTSAAEHPRPYSQMLTWHAHIRSTAPLDDLLAEDRAWALTHPSLRERLARLHEEARMPPLLARSAGEEILGDTLRHLAARLDEDWMSSFGDAWVRERTRYLERRATLERLEALDAPSPEEAFMRAELLAALSGSDAALPHYQRAAGQGHAAAGLAAGRVLLGRGDAAGVELVESAMERDEHLVPEGCKVLAEYYRETQQLLAARKCEWRARSYATRLRLAQQQPMSRGASSNGDAIDLATNRRGGR